jgi:hypothetical protein
VQQDGVEAHASGAGLPVRARAVLAQAGQLLPPSSERWITWPNQLLDCDA